SPVFRLYLEIMPGRDGSPLQFAGDDCQVSRNFVVAVPAVQVQPAKETIGEAFQKIRKGSINYEDSPGHYLASEATFYIPLFLRPFFKAGAARVEAPKIH